MWNWARCIQNAHKYFLLLMQIDLMYERKKEKLLLLYRKEGNKAEQLKLVHEINILAELRHKPQIDINHIPDTLRVYPSKIK